VARIAAGWVAEILADEAEGDVEEGWLAEVLENEIECELGSDEDRIDVLDGDVGGLKVVGGGELGLTTFVLDVDVEDWELVGGNGVDEVERLLAV